MPEVANPVPVPVGSGINERAVLVARRNGLMSELLKIAPAINPPPPPTAERKHVDRQPPKQVREFSPEVKIKRMVNRDQKVEKPDAFADNPVLQTVRGVSIDLLDYFSINMDKAEDQDIRKLLYVQECIAGGNKNFRSGLKKLNSIDNRLGSADVGVAKLSKLYNWLRLRDGNTKA